MLKKLGKNQHILAIQNSDFLSLVPFWWMEHMGVLFIKLALLFSMSTKIPHHDNIYQDTYRFKFELIT